MRVPIILGSKTDTEYAQKIVDVLTEFGVPSEIIVASAHKVPEKVVTIVEELNNASEPIVIITVVGMSNGLGGVLAGTSIHPVISCPPFKDMDDYLVNIHSNLQMPSDVPLLTVLNPKNAALCAVRIFAEGDAKLRTKLEERRKKIQASY
ncbi:MAG: 5-(carboxyamino)imidazole ribonucleotide mutase [Candidatus Peregrinibacteria bacterium]|nr:5-(carboxyamino)imidazole ribonucleotide mutase [Candidatus Peregrinibacteria bacterium]